MRLPEKESNSWLLEAFFACTYLFFVLQYLYKEENIRASAQHRERRFGFGHLKRLFFAQKTPDIAIGSCGLDADGQSGRPPKELFAAPAEPIVEPRCY